MRTATLCLLALLAAPDALAKQPKRPVNVTSQIHAVLDAQLPALEDCVLRLAIGKGSKSVDLGVKLLINSLGQVLGCHVDAQADGAAHEPLRQCSQQVLSTAKYPKSRTPLIKIERHWGFSTN